MNRAAPVPPAPQDAQLLNMARGGLPLVDEPFAELGRALGMNGEEVIERLRGLVGSGVIERIVPVFAVGADAGFTDPWDVALRDATDSGLPLLQRPFEALGAMLGVPAAQVRDRLALWTAQGRMLRIAAVAGPSPP